MKIDIIHPAHYSDDGTLVQAKGLIDRFGAYLPHLGPPLIAALTPDRHQVRLVDEYLEDVDFDTDADVVAMSAQIMQFDRARDLSTEFRKRGKKTILGGYLPSMLPDRVEGLFDAIVVGEGDEVWPELLSDIERNRLRSVYRPVKPVDLSNLPVPRYDLILKDRIVVHPVQATRGCPYTCQYCSIASVFQGAYRKHPIDHILRDIEATKSKNINFCDDNLCEDVKFVDELFTAMAGTSIRWGTQTTMNVARHPELLKKAKKAGCALLALGVETLSARNLEDVQKTFHAVDKYAEGFQRIMDAGISPHALIIFGLPADNLDTFHRTVEYLENLKVPIAQFFILTPYPSTPTGDKIWNDGKVFDKNLSHLREPYVVFRHETLSTRELHDGWWSAVEEFYSLRSILKRILLRKPNNLFVDLATNLYYWSKVKRGIHTVYFGRG